MKRIVAFVDGTDDDTQALATAAAFARFAGARLTVVHATRRPPVSVLADVPPVLEDENEIAARTAIARRGFDAARAAGADVEWIAADDAQEDAIRRYGLVSDVVALERADADHGPDAIAFNTALFETGAPVLVCPSTPWGSGPAEVGRSVALVWSPTAQAARVARSALPALGRAGAVTVLTNEAERRIDASPVLAWLELHGIKAAHRPFDGSGLTARGRGRAILKAVAGWADLLIMGAYGEKSLSERLGLGRATEKVLGASPIPVLVQT